MSKGNGTEGLFLFGGLAGFVATLFAGSVVLAVSFDEPKHNGYSTSDKIESIAELQPVPVDLQSVNHPVNGYVAAGQACTDVPASDGQRFASLDGGLEQNRVSSVSVLGANTRDTTK